MKKTTINTCITETSELMSKSELTGADYGKILILSNCFCYVSQLVKNSPIKVKGIAKADNDELQGACFDFLTARTIQAPNVQTALDNGTLKPEELADFIPLLNVANSLYNMTNKLEHHLTMLNDNFNRLFATLREFRHAESVTLLLKASHATTEEKKAIFDELITLAPQDLIKNTDRQAAIKAQINNILRSFAFVQAYNKYIELLAEETGINSIRVYAIVEGTVKDTIITSINEHAKLVKSIIYNAVENLQEDESTLNAFNECITSEPLKPRRTIAKKSFEEARAFVQYAITQPNTPEYLNNAFYVLQQGFIKK